MAAELRYILFSPSEVAQALTYFYEQAAMKLPDGIIHDIELTRTDQVTAAFKVRKNVYGTIVPVEVDEERLMNAMILYCRRQRICLSRAAIKSLDINDGYLELCLSLGLRPEHRSRIKQLLPCPSHRAMAEA